jgi:membrane fusion protein, multidrug efflux system
VYGRMSADGKIEPIIGRINFVSAQVDVSTGTALIRAEVPNPERRLRPGQFLNVMGEGVMRLNALIVPREAVVQNPSGASVYVAVTDDKGVHAESRPVTLGDWQDEGWIITDGLKPGDRVIVDRLAQMRPGTAVTMAKAEGETPVAAAGPTANSH